MIGEEKDKGISISPTQPLNPYDTAAAPLVCEAAGQGATMSTMKEVISVEADRPPALHVPEDLENEGADEPMAPTTPGTERSMQGQSTITKMPQGARADEVQQQILTAVLSLQATTQDTKVLLNRLTDRVMAHDRTLEDIEIKLSAMRAVTGKEYSNLGSRIDEVQKTMASNDEKMKDFQTPRPSWTPDPRPRRSLPRRPRHSQHILRRRCSSWGGSSTTRRGTSSRMPCDQ